MSMQRRVRQSERARGREREEARPGRVLQIKPWTGDSVRRNSLINWKTPGHLAQSLVPFYCSPQFTAGFREVRLPESYESICLIFLLFAVPPVVLVQYRHRPSPTHYNYHITIADHFNPIFFCRSTAGSCKPKASEFCQNQFFDLPEILCDSVHKFCFDNAESICAFLSDCKP